MNDDAGEPGNVIESFQLDVPNPACPSFVGILSADSVDQPVLDASAQYWLVATAAQSNTQLGWWFDTGCFGSGNGPTLKSMNGGAWVSQTYGTGAFRVSGEAILRVLIDIKPGSDPNGINPRSRGKVAVAILTTSVADGEILDFDASDVDETSILFGVTGYEAEPLKFSLEDVDYDGDLDMVLHFRTRDTDILCGDIAALLTGETYSGDLFEGSDSVKTPGCK